MLRNFLSRLFRGRRKNKFLEEFKDAELERGELESNLGRELYSTYWEGKAGHIYASKPITDATDVVGNGRNGYSNGNRYFILPFMPEPSVEGSLHDFWQIYMGRIGYGWLENLMELEKLASTTRLNSEMEVRYIKGIKDDLYGFSKNGYLAIEIGNRKEIASAAERPFTL